MTVVGLATGLGALPTVLGARVNHRVYETSLGLAGGIVLAASVFGFVLVGVAQGVFPIAAGFAAGLILAVVLREVVLSSHGHGYADAATAAFLVGSVVLGVVVDSVITV